MHRFILAGLILAAGAPQLLGDFRYDVRRDKLWGGETGVLTIGEQGGACRT